ncbi:MAG: type II toxin-antitoxin system RelE/ParE family toxin [Brevundimonas sp.]
MRRHRTSSEADEDLIAIFEQGIERFGRRQADRYLDDLWRTFGRLADFPGIGRLRTENQPPVRTLAYQAHVIIYEEDDGGVLIIRVRRGREDWRNDPRGSDEEQD